VLTGATATGGGARRGIGLFFPDQDGQNPFELYPLMMALVGSTNIQGVWAMTQENAGSR
jgi:hypothetical protein